MFYSCIEEAPSSKLASDTAYPDNCNCGCHKFLQEILRVVSHLGPTCS